MIDYNLFTQIPNGRYYANQQTTRSFLNSHFKIDIEGVATWSFVQISVLHSGNEVIKYADSIEPNMRKRAERTSFSNITLTKGALSSHEL